MESHVCLMSEFNLLHDRSSTRRVMPTEFWVDQIGERAVQGRTGSDLLVDFAFNWELEVSDTGDKREIYVSGRSFALLAFLVRRAFA